MPPCDAVIIMSRSSYFGELFLLETFQCLLSKLVRLSMCAKLSYRPMEGTKTWSNDGTNGKHHAYLALRRGRLPASGTWPGCAYHAWWSGEAVLSAVRRWSAGGI